VTGLLQNTLLKFLLIGDYDMIEYLDVFDVDMNPTGDVCTREEAYREGYWLKNFHCWIVRREAPGYLLFQLRSADKKLFPNMLDTSSAGHVGAGKSIEEEGLREIKEELGLDVSVLDLTFLGIHKNASNKAGFPVRQFLYTYILECSERLEDYKLQLEEVDGLFEMSFPDGFKLFSGEVESVSVRGVVRDGDVYKSEVRDVSLEDIVPTFSRYLLRVFIMAERYLKGEKYLAI